MKRTRLQRSAFRVRSRGATEKPAALKRVRLKPMSAKRRRLMPQRVAMVLGLKELVDWRCEFCRDAQCWPLDGHEVRKPRARYWLNPDYVCILGRPHHDMAEAAYGSRTGRLEIPGTRSTGWGFYVDYGRDKFAARAATPLLNKRYSSRELSTGQCG